VSRLPDEMPPPNRGHLSLVPRRDEASAPRPDEGALLARLSQGDMSVVGPLFDLHAARVERILFRMLGTDSELSDLVHDVFLRAIAHAAKLKEPEAFTAWLQRVAVTTATDLLRARKRRRTWFFLFAPDSLPELAAPEFDHEGREALRTVNLILDELPPEDRVAFSLRVLEGMELSEVASSCDCSIATIKRRVDRARAHLASRARQYPSLAHWVEGKGGS